MTAFSEAKSASVTRSMAPFFRMSESRPSRPFRIRPAWWAAATPARRVLAILCPAASSAEQKLLWLFGLQLTDDYTLSIGAAVSASGDADSYALI